MVAKPDFYSADHAAAFQFPGVAAAYWTRPEYPPATYAWLASLAVDNPSNVLDLGCGTGFIARALAPNVARVDAIDISEAMIVEGRKLHGGDASNITWIAQPAETAPLNPPYALAVAGASLHWMDWPVVLPRIAGALSQHGRLIILDVMHLRPPWQDGLLEIILRFTTNRTLRMDFDWIGHIAAEGLMDIEERGIRDETAVRQSIVDYIESFHARESLTRERLGAEASAAFDTALREVVRPHEVDGQLDLKVRVSYAVTRPLLR